MNYILPIIFNGFRELLKLATKLPSTFFFLKLGVNVFSGFFPPQFGLNFFNNFRHFLKTTPKKPRKCINFRKNSTQIEGKMFFHQKTLTPAFQENSVC